MKPSAFFPIALYAAFVVTPPARATAKHATQVHIVESGQRLGSIAKRLGVSADDLRRANDLRPGATLKIGQRLVIPNPEASENEDDGHRRTAVDEARPSIVKASLAVVPAAPLRHRVRPGETLAQIAVRYGTSVAALAARNDLGKTKLVQPDQILALPRGVKPVQKSWHPYAKPAKRTGYLNVSTPIANFTGLALDKNGRVRSSAARALNALLGAGGARPPLPERLIRLLVKVSDTFSGRPIRLVSGYRSTSYYEDSRHKLSSAVDFLVVGVPNAIICDYLRELEDVGVGYYPNSSFVHLDVRNHFAYWVDYGGPGEAPRSTPNAPSAPRGPDRRLLAELDSVLKQAKGAIEEAGARKEHEPAPPNESEREDPPESRRPGGGEATTNAGTDET